MFSIRGAGFFYALEKQFLTTSFPEHKALINQ
jgi:hypothetical protein